MPTRASGAFWTRVTFHALWLHGGWEVAQCRLFYDMSGASPFSAFFFMAGATGADVFLTLLLIKVTLAPERFQNFAATGRSLTTLVALGAVTAVFIEFLAWKFGWWRYSLGMPTLQLDGQAIGLWPVLQMALLPSLAFFLARIPLHPQR